MRPAALPFSERLEIGKSYELKVSKFLTSVGFPIGLHLTKKRQWEFGESAAHVEIKWDGKYWETKHLFIETRERRNSNGSSAWRPSGIFDESDPWFYAIGDEARLWLLSTAWLIALLKTGKYKEKKTDTAEGFLLPLFHADYYAIRMFSNIDAC